MRATVCKLNKNTTSVPQRRLRGSVVVRSQPNMTPEMQEQMRKAMQDPAFAERMRAMQEAMQKPEVQSQMNSMMAMMQNKALQERMASLKDDPEFAEMFAEIQKGGMAALSKYWNDPRVLAKLGSKLGDVAGEAPAAAQAPAVAAQPPEIDNLLDAARYGDDEAVEDFIAIGKDVNMKDKENRTPSHYAAAYNHTEILMMLIEAGANIENTDSMGNTPLHYAAGYARPETVRTLVQAGANKNAVNQTGKTAHQLVTAEPRNPLNQDTAILDLLKA